VLDVGAGPGYATLDLADRVGTSGVVVAVERSQRFLDHAREAVRQRGHTHVRFIERDLMADPISESGFDAAWCRWVAAFVADPSRLVAMLYGLLKPGGRVVFHEYANYRSWRLAPRSPVFETFVDRVVETWRAAGGEPDIGLELPALLHRAGFRLVELRPLVFVGRPGDQVWAWPASFIESGLNRLIELGAADASWADVVRRTFAVATADPATAMVTPLVLEIIAERM
jgi:SAM-dependent methyltransferase